MFLLGHHAKSMFGLEIEINEQPFPDGPTEHVIVLAVLVVVLLLCSYGAFAMVRDLLRWRRAAEAKG